MTERKRSVVSEVVLVVVALGLGLAGAGAYAAWRAVSAEGARTLEFFDSLLFPGILIIAGIAAMVWLGWKANID